MMLRYIFINLAQVAAISEFQAWCQLLIAPQTFMILDTVQYLHETLLQSFVLFVSVDMLRKKKYVFVNAECFCQHDRFDRCHILICIWCFTLFFLKIACCLSLGGENPPEWRRALFHSYFQICTNVDSRSCTESWRLHDSTNCKKALYSAYTINVMYAVLVQCTVLW